MLNSCRHRNWSDLSMIIKLNQKIFQIFQIEICQIGQTVNILSEWLRRLLGVEIPKNVFWGSMPQIPLEACFFCTLLGNRSVFILDLWLSWHSNAAKLIIQHCCVTNNIINCIKNVAHIPQPFRKMPTSYKCFLTQQAPVQMLDSAISTD